MGMGSTAAAAGGIGGCCRGLMPAAGMVVVQLGYAGLSVLSKLAMDDGMSPFVLIAYRNIFAAVALSLVAVLYEKEARKSITKKVVFQIFLSSIFGATLNQIFYFCGLKNSTPTVAAALNNMLPALTFIMAVPLRMERLGMRTSAGQAKVVGTLVCVGGSMLMTFYKGTHISVWHSPIHWKYAERYMASSTRGGGEQNMALGAAFVIASCLAWAAWLIIQTKMSTSFSYPNATSAMLCGMASVQCAVVAVCFEPRPAAWSLDSSIRLSASLYIGLVGSGLAILLMTWCITERGPLFVSMFNPLLLIIVAVVDWALLDEKLYLGSVTGSALIVGGLFMVTWGKGREMKLEDMDDVAESSADTEGDSVLDESLSVTVIELPVPSAAASYYSPRR